MLNSTRDNFVNKNNKDIVDIVHESLMSNHSFIFILVWLEIMVLTKPTK